MMKFNLIDNAPTVKERIEYGTDGKPYILSISNGSEYSRPTGEYQKKALKLLDSLQDENKITVRQVGTLRRAILTEPERLQGEWLDIKPSYVSKAVCSICREVAILEPFGNPKYCPNCGARMKGAEE